MMNTPPAKMRLVEVGFVVADPGVVARVNLVHFYCKYFNRLSKYSHFSVVKHLDQKFTADNSAS